MDESERLPKFRKDALSEEFLQRFNHQLVPLQSAEEAKQSAPKLPTVFIVGAPRSGTTLMSQLLAFSGCFGYVSNFVARFWLAPAVGARLQRSLGTGPERDELRFESMHGVTRGWGSPHEFGYYWSRWFDLGQDTHKLSDEEIGRVDRVALQRSLASLELAFGLPMAFKNSSWCTLQADFLAQVFPLSIFVVCRRDPLFVAQSILQARRERYGNENIWWSIRPPDYQHLLNLPWWDQIAGQIVGITDEVAKSVARIPTERVIDADYDLVCSNPAAVIDRLIESCRLRGATMTARPTIPARFESTNKVRIDDSELNLLRKAIDSRLSLWSTT